jgi:phospholipid/cholesterol/gamma-HCH transport system substrate-binding protein
VSEGDDAMTEHRNELRVGITLALAGVALVVGVLWLSNFQLGSERYGVNVVFEEVAGLVPGDKVTVAGLDAGEVVSLELDGGKVMAAVELDPNIRIPVDSRISVASYGLIGAKVVSIRPGSSAEYIAPGATVDGWYEKGLGDVVSEMGEALTEIRRVLHAADDVLTDVQGRERVKETLGNARDATFDMKEAVADFKVIAADLRGFVHENKETVGAAIVSAEEASAGFAEVSQELKALTTSLDSIVKGVERGEGTLGKLVTDDAAHEEFLAAVTEVRDLVAEIRRNPKTFVRFSIW